MVIEVDTQSDSPEEVSEKINQAVHQLADSEAEKKKSLKLAAFGKVKWDEDALEYQKRLRDKWR